MRNKVHPIKNGRVGTTMLSIALILVSLAACTDIAILNQHASINDGKWHYNEQPTFETKVTDNRTSYDLYLSLRHSANYRFSNIYLLLKEETPTRIRKTYRVEIKLAEPDGRWLGTGGGNLYSHEVRVLKNYVYPDTGVYTYRLEQNMRVNPLLEVEDVGIRIVPSEN